MRNELTKPQREYVSKTIRVLQIIVMVMVMGIATFTIAAVLVQREDIPEEPLLVYFAAGFSVLVLPPWVLVPSLIVRSSCQALANGTGRLQHMRHVIPEDVGASGQLAGIYQTKGIVALALLEGAAFFNLIAFFFERQTLSLGITIMILVLQLTHYPSLTRAENWIRRQQEDYGIR